jgi:predicted TIM-barrel fold metal-dependent hydrolase
MTTVDSKRTASSLKIIDVDSHVVEPPDLWTARMSGKFKDIAPRVLTRPETGAPTWRIGDKWASPVGEWGYAGHDKYPPDYPVTLEQIDPGAWKSKERLERMDEYGLHAQVLYPNLIGFDTRLFVDLGPEASLDSVRAYNDFLVDFCSADKDRLVPIAMVPFWDIEAAVKEIRRCRERGHRGVLFGNKYERMGMGLPPVYESHWDPIYAVVDELDLSINFHVGVGESAEGVSEEKREFKERREAAAKARDTALLLMTNAEPIAHIVTSDVCDRFPNVKFVSVESGFGYVPFLLEILDWQWKTYGADRYRKTLPSEYFRRQCYGSLWFETGTLDLLRHYPDNFMFETDYPHPTSLTPGPCSPAERPIEHIQHNYGGLPEEIVRKLVHDNAARVYGL